MQAKDLMTTDVVAVTGDTPLNVVAKHMLDRGISAVPVVDSTGTAIGMVSEGDLVGRSDAERDARRDWWLALLAEGSQLHPDFLATFRPSGKAAKDVMAAPVITITEETDGAEIARLLTEYRVKRLPVVRDGRIVGIVSCADLLRELFADRPEPASAHPAGLVARTLDELDRHFLHTGHPAAGAERVRPAGAHREEEEKVTAKHFRALVGDFEESRSHRSDEERLARAIQRKTQTKELIDHHIEERKWKELLHEARTAAEHGKKEVLLLRFPAQLCSDGGRAVNAPEPGWPSTLRGEAAEIYLRWEHDMRRQGFHLNVRVLDFPGGKPGDIGLFLGW